MDTVVAAHEDYCHALEAHEHEAFYFLFSTPDAGLFGLSRLLLGQHTLLEMLVLKSGAETWVHQQVVPRGDGVGCGRLDTGDADAPPAQVAGPAQSFTCRVPWQQWGLHFAGDIRGVAGVGEAGMSRPCTLALEFTALNSPARYRSGPYQQVEQEGRMQGTVQVGSRTVQERWWAYRDHSWGQRRMMSATGWTIAVLPDHFYAVSVNGTEGDFFWGRMRAGERFVPLPAMQIQESGEGWRMVLGEEAGGEWAFQRPVPPIVAHLGQAGVEEIRDTERPGDLYRDSIGPATFTSPEGDALLGFVERARRVDV